MAFRNLVEGDCGNPNSLIQFTSHYTKDLGFKDEGIHKPFHPSGTIETPCSDQFVQEFLQESSCPQTFRMDNLMHEVSQIEQNIHAPIAIPRVEELTTFNPEWTSQYIESKGPFGEHLVEDIWNTYEVQPIKNDVFHLPEIHESNLNSKWTDGFIEENINSVQIDDKNTDFLKCAEQKIIPIEDNNMLFENTTGNTIENYMIEQQPNATNGCVVIDDNFLNEVEQDLEAAGTSWSEDFGSDNEYYYESDDESNDFESRTELKDSWKNSHHKEPETEEELFEREYRETFKTYEFQDPNPMKDMPDALAEGKKLLEQKELQGAILCFEAAVQQDANSNEAWLLLGRAQNENENDPLAIYALKRCLELDPTNGEAMMWLAVSYTNESFRSQAALMLKKWLLTNEKYKHLTYSESAINPNRLPLKWYFHTTDLRYQVEDLYIQAARMNPTDGIDPEVQNGLGILYTLACDYRRAADCFKIAVQLKPNDHRLWSRWGAALCNSQNPSTAIHAYYRALELLPGFTRARFNLAISCLSLEAHREAVDHLLTGLNLQAKGRKNIDAKNSMSHTMWNTLKLAVTLLNKEHLLDAVNKRDLPLLNKEFGFE